MENIIGYHYTKIDTAIKYILHDKRIRLSPRLNASDPFENNYSNFVFNDPYAKLNDEQDIVSYIAKNRVKDYIKQIKQLSFSTNKVDISEVYNVLSTYDNGPGDFGFYKPRMWDQYGGLYKGVCLTIDLKKLIEGNVNLSPKHHLVEYLNATEFFKEPINHEEFKKENIDEIIQKETERYNSFLFKKHIDYRDENEYKIITRSESEFDYFDLHDSLIAITFDPLTICDFDIKMIQQYKKLYKCSVYELTWSEIGIDKIKARLSYN